MNAAAMPTASIPVASIPIALIGMGRMGRALEVLAPDRGLEVVARLDATEMQRGLTPQDLHGARVAIEFTEPGSAVGNAVACLNAGCPVVIGTTGWVDERHLIEEAVRRNARAALWSPNFSIGVQLFLAIADLAARRMRDVATFDPHVVETHHTAKKDAPSGTAIAIAAQLKHGLAREVPITSVRVGSVPGTHEVIFDAPFEQIRFVHEARDRRVFADGALAAARWLAADRRPRLYSMRDVLGDRVPMEGGNMTDGRLHGCGTALVTPFRADGTIDEAALRDLVDWQLREGVHFLVPCGSTGEAVTLSPLEHRRVVEITVEQVNGRVPVVAGAGSNDTQRAIALSREARAAGATHLLHVTPMYNKPPQRALIAHFRAIADACDLPIVLYNVPGRTAVNLEARTCLTLAQDPRFVGVKEASGNLGQMTDIIRERPDGFAVLSGDDGFTLAVMAHGGEGLISVVSNAVPHLCASLCNAMARGDLADARRLEARLAPVVQAAFIESNPIPVKAMLHLQQRIANVLRLPLVPLSEVHHETVRRALASANAI